MIWEGHKENEGTVVKPGFSSREEEERGFGVKVEDVDEYVHKMSVSKILAGEAI